MDRALNLDHIHLALGDTTRLPSARELIDTIAETEVALFRGLEEVDPALADVAWYLHSVASALPALELYGLDRQRAAFQVAGHIFDLLLADPNLPSLDRLRYVFAAQVAYLRGDLNPNAIAAYRSRPDSLSTTSFTDPSLGLRTGTALLAFDTNWLFPALQQARKQRDEAGDQWGVDPGSTIFGTASLALDGMWDLLLYLVYGDQGRLATARGGLSRAVSNAPSSEDLDSRWVAFHLLQLADQLGASSLWSVLPPDTSPSMARAFTMARPSILSFWPPQVDLLRRDRTPNAFDPAVRRMVLSVPTSAGKTLLAQVLVADHLVRTGSGVCFVAPTRSLCREIEASLRRRLRLIATASEIALSDLTFEVPLVDEVAVEVMTPERLAYLMRADPGEVLRRFGLFIIDEAHTLTDGTRGWTLEWVLSTLHHLSADSAHRIVVMSAALGERANLVAWLDPSGAGIHFHSDWRGPRRVHSIYTSEPDWDHPRDVPRPRANSPLRREYDTFGVLRLRPSGAGRIHELRTTAPVGKLVLRPPSLAKDDRSTPFYKSLAPLATILGRAGPVLVISPTKVEAARLAGEIAERTEAGTTAPIWLIDLASARLGDAHPLVACLRRGVAYHHASLPGDVLLGIEEALTADALRFVVATTTLTEGVNLPVRTVIIAAQGAFAGEGYEEFITGARLLNAIGRAGRAARESEGWVVLARNAAFTPADFDRLQPTEADMPVRSVLVSDLALEQLAFLEAEIARGVDLALARPGQVVEGFLSYVWYVASVLEATDQDATPDAVAEFLAATLAWRQLDDVGRRRWRTASARATESYHARPPETRRRWSRAGTSLAAASVLDRIALEVSAEVAGQQADGPAAALPLLIRGDRLARILALPEAQRRPLRTSRGGHGQLIEIDESALLTDWLAGAAVTDLANTYLHEVADAEFRLEQLADHLTATFENFLPWAVGIVIEWANQTLSASDGGASVDTSLPAFIRYGVDSLEAVSLVRAGIPSRSMATAVARDYLADRENVAQALRPWLCTYDLADWRDRYHPSPGELRALLEFARAPGTRLAARLLGGETIEVPVRPLGAPPQAASAEIREITGEPSPARLGIWVDSELVGALLPEHVAEIEAVRATGVPMRVTLRATEDSLLVSIVLVSLFEAA